MGISFFTRIPKNVIERVLYFLRKVISPFSFVYDLLSIFPIFSSQIFSTQFQITVYPIRGQEITKLILFQLINIHMFEKILCVYEMRLFLLSHNFRKTLFFSRDRDVKTKKKTRRCEINKLYKLFSPKEIYRLVIYTCYCVVVYLSICAYDITKYDF